MEEQIDLKSNQEVYMPSLDEGMAIREVLDTFQRGRDVLSKSYEYFNGLSLFEKIDDWTKRWNGYIPPLNPLLDRAQSQIFVNFTRNAIISYIAKVAMSPVKVKIKAVNKKSGLPDQKFADILKDLKKYSEDNENAEAKFMQAGIECAVKGTVVVYEGYMRQEQKTSIVDDFDATTGKVSSTKGKRVIFDDCFQQVVPLEDFYITNPFQPDVQKQPKVIWKSLTTKSEAEMEFGHYPKWKYVTPGRYVAGNDVTTFYREVVLTSIGKDQVEILKYYNRSDNRHVIMANGVILYDGPIPFKDGMYPFAKTINEPFGVEFFWGNGHPGKYMGEQDLINSFINMMADKTFNSLAPTGLSSDLDDLIDDDVIQVGKMRKVGDIEKWRWWEPPPVSSGEQNMFQTILSLGRESANTDAGSSYSPKGGKLQARQIAQKQQEVMQKLSFNMSFLEDLERDRSMLRLSHILQFYSIPKMQKITSRSGKELQKMTYRDINLTNTKLSDGRQGNKMIKIISNEYKNADKRAKLADELSVKEAQGELQGMPTEALAISIDTFNDFNFEVQVVKNSSFEKNQVLDQAQKLEYSQWRIQMAQLGVPTDLKELTNWVSESFDIDVDRFEPKTSIGQNSMQNPQNSMQGAVIQPGTQVPDQKNLQASPQQQPNPPAGGKIMQQFGQQSAVGNML